MKLLVEVALEAKVVDLMEIFDRRILENHHLKGQFHFVENLLVSRRQEAA